MKQLKLFDIAPKNKWEKLGKALEKDLLKKLGLIKHART